MSKPVPRQSKGRKPLPAVSKKKIARTYAGTLLKKVILTDLTGAGLSRPETGYILAYIHQIGDQLSEGYLLRKQDFVSIATYFTEENE